MLPPLTRQRAGAGFMVSEAAQAEPRGQGDAWTPGMYSQAQVAGRRRVTDAVHADGGIILAQLRHVGRGSHSALQPAGAAPGAGEGRVTEKAGSGPAKRHF